MRLTYRAAATQSGDLHALTQLLASDVRVVTDGGGKVRVALNVVRNPGKLRHLAAASTPHGRGSG